MEIKFWNKEPATKFRTWDKKKLVEEIELLMMKDPFILLPDYPSTPLGKMTIFQLHEVYLAYMSLDRDFCQAYEDELEKNRFFNQSDCKADFNYWSKQAYWSIDEAITLVLNKDPRIVIWDEVKKYVHRSLFISSFANKFNELRELAKRYIHCKKLFDPTPPSAFLEWAQKMSIDIPIELSKAVDSLDIHIVERTSFYEEKEKSYFQSNELYLETLNSLTEKEKIIEQMTLRVSQLENIQQKSNENNLQETEKKSLFKIIATMAYDGYGYDPTKNSDTHKEISEAATKLLGENIHTDTVRKWLKQAIDRYPKTLLKTE